MELSFLTYNIHKGIGLDRLYRMDRIISICKSLKPDIIALQEIPEFAQGSKDLRIAEMIAEELQMSFVQGINVKLRRGVAYGNAIFSKFPILTSSNTNITWSIKKPRGCLNAIIKLPDSQELTVMNFHLGLAGIERRMQMKKILQSLFLITQKGNPIVLMGDTNDVYNRLEKYTLSAGFKDSSSKDNRIKTFPSYAPIWRLDRIYYSKELTLKNHEVIKNQLTRISSDHLPLQVTMKLI